MDIKQRVGQYLRASTAGEGYRTYIPKLLPPEPPLQMEKIYPLLDQANVAVGRLDGVGNALPDHELFLYLYIRKELTLIN